MTEFTVMGGETCQVDAGGAQRVDCATALRELAQFHWDYLNIDFYQQTIDKWRADGCFDEIEARLGYRFEMVRSTGSTRAAVGGPMALELEIRNEGFGKLYNPRPINVVLVDNDSGAQTRFEVAVDARTVLPLPGATATMDLGLQVPSDLPPGSYSIHIELPDGSANLAGDPRFSIQMANAGTWNADDGTNDLGLDIEIGG